MRGQFASGFLERDKFDLNEFVQGQLMDDAGKEGLAHAAVPHFQDGFKMLRFALEGASVGGCQLRLQARDFADFSRELKNGNAVASEPLFI